jgi:nucleotide-binding universal stress UspA family protein
MGTTGTNLVKEMTFGSSFAGLVGTITCPILAIPIAVVYKPLKEIGMACDYEFLYTKELLTPLIELANQQKSNLAVLHVLNGKNKLSDAELKVKENLKHILPISKTEFYTLSDIKVPVAIQAFAESRKLDLICIISKKYGVIERLLGQTYGKSISKQTEIPLLVLHCATC